MAEPTDNGIVWADPEDVKPRSRTLWRDRLLPVMERPGQWARVWEMSHGSAWQVTAQLRRGIKPTPPGRWEFATRTSTDDSSKAYVYARYLGPEDGAS